MILDTYRDMLGRVNRRTGKNNNRELDNSRKQNRLHSATKLNANFVGQ